MKAISARSRGTAGTLGGRASRMGLALVLTTGAVAGAAGTAQAVGGFHTSASSVRVRAGASTQTTQISTVVSTGTAIDISCQTSGESVTAAGFGTSAVWDKLNGYNNGYISDLFVQETVYAQFDARIPRCTTTPVPVTTREAKALAWANGQIGRYTDDWGRAVSYTHLTLPTICSV